MKPATLDTIDGHPVLRFERLLRHPPHKVWKAITDPAELAHWFPARVETELRVGATMRFTFENGAGENGAGENGAGENGAGENGTGADGTGDGGPVEQPPDGEIIEFDPPKVFAYRWGQDLLRWELVGEDSGCRLHFSHVISDAHGGAAAAGRNAAGWDTCLDALSARLDNRPPPTVGDSPAPPTDPAQMLEQIEAYIERFGLSCGEVLDRPDGCVLRFERDLVWTPPDQAWATLTGTVLAAATVVATTTADTAAADTAAADTAAADTAAADTAAADTAAADDDAATIGEQPPPSATNDAVPAGPVTAAEPPRLLEYDWLHDGRPAGRVRWEITADPLAGTRLVLTQTVPARLSGLREPALAAWQAHIGRLFAAMFGQTSRP